MKKFIYLLSSLLILNSCGVYQTRELQKYVMFVDYTPYIEAGFFLSPNDYPGPHTPVGELNIVIDPEVKRTEYGVSVTDLNPEDLLRMAVSEATKRGSNGISNLKIEVITQDYAYYKTEGLLATSVMTTPVNRYIISGVLIRIMNQE